MAERIHADVALATEDGKLLIQVVDKSGPHDGKVTVEALFTLDDGEKLGWAILEHVMGARAEVNPEKPWGEPTPGHEAGEEGAQ